MGYYNIDIHVHTQRYSPCAELLNPAELDRIAQIKNIHGIVITEHNITWPQEEIDELNRMFKFTRLYRGAEISCIEGHFVVIGVSEIEENIKGIAISELSRMVQLEKGTVIWAHPHQFPIKESAIKGIHAIEVASSITFGENQQDALRIAEKRKWVAVAGSDAHYLDCIGSAYTSFYKLPQDEKELASLINQGSCFFGRQDNR